jgi:hypothetical protein
VPPGITLEEALAKPFHVYDPDFYDIIGNDPTLTVLASQGTNPLYHEAVVWWVFPRFLEPWPDVHPGTHPPTRFSSCRMLAQQLPALVSTNQISSRRSP